MKWTKRGLVFSPNGQRPWMQTHATHPIVLPLYGDVHRVYFSCRDGKNHSHVGYVELSINSYSDISYISDEPALSPGPLGNFDEHGVYAGCLIPYERKLFMYFIGWTQGVKPPLFYASIGLAVSTDGGRTFDKVSPAPIMARSQFDPCTVLLPHVMKEDDVWRMWYGSGFKWKQHGGKLRSYYDIKYAESADGVHWDRDGKVCIGLEDGETNLGHPFVIIDSGLYKMWYSVNAGDGYRIGYAESSDGYTWTRKDHEAGIELSQTAWDSEATCHPHVFLQEGKKYMLYNGNEFGRDGFGLAVAEDD